MKRKLKFENYKNCLEASQLQNEITIQSKIKLIQTGFEKNHKEFIKKKKKKKKKNKSLKVKSTVLLLKKLTRLL